MVVKFPHKNRGNNLRKPFSIMAKEYPDIGKLPKSSKYIYNTEKCLTYLPTIATKAKTDEEVKSALQHIVAVIEFEISAKSRNGEACPANQVILNTAYRAYFRLQQQHALSNASTITAPQPNLLYSEECGFQMLYAILLTDQEAKTIDTENLMTVCSKALSDAVNADCGSLLYILKLLNLLLEKFPTLNSTITLQQIYHCLQNNRFGMRDESMQLFTKCCRQATVAFEHFQVILEFWPWSNRYKFYLLSCILKTHNLKEFLINANHGPNEFYAGLRLSLSHKSLLAASQYLVKALSVQNSDELLLMSADIIMRGSIKEIKNFNAHWYARIDQKDKLFEFLQMQPDITSLLENTTDGGIDQEYYRPTLIFSMFSRQIFQVSKLHFFKITTELMTNCFQFAIETQILVFKFIVDNLASFAIEDCLEFTIAFIKKHKCIDNAQYRNEILGKLPAIINYVAKAFNKIYNEEVVTTIESSIQSFFKQVHILIEAEIDSAIYQPKIFSLRLLDILLKSLYANNLEKNAKNCCIAQNRKLGKFLMAQNIFEADKMSAALFKLLNDPFGFDDALDLILQLLRQIKYADAAKSAFLCKEFSQRCDVDECVLSTLYARATLNCCKSIGKEDDLLDLLEYGTKRLKTEINDFHTDPLHVCKTRNHLFGYVNIMGEIVQSNINLSTEKQNEILDLLEKILNIILEFLNVCKADTMQTATNAASFQDMDESLGILVRESVYKLEDNGESRKFLLMSFWLTLKAACDLATEIGCRYVTDNGQDSTDFRILSRCLDINVAVLIRCRHKGAIEAAGVSIGKLTKSITSKLLPSSGGYNLLENCLDLLFDNTKQVSITRRGAGYSIMMLHIVKNEQQRPRPLLKRVMGESLRLLNENRATNASHADNFDRFEALLLHYLGVLVRDTELRDATSLYYDEILLVTLKRIEHPDWTEFNAALQLFGALIPKVVGQTPAKDFDAPAGNENNDTITYDEIIRKLPTACEFILNYFAAKQHNKKISTRTTVLFLGFLSKVKHLPKQADPFILCCFVENIRELMWVLLAHRCERVRNLAALCFVRAHDFRFELPQALISISNMLCQISDENFFMGLVLTLSEGLLRLQHENLHSNNASYKHFLRSLRSSLANLELSHHYKPYSLGKLLDIFLMVRVDRKAKSVRALLEMFFEGDSIGYDMWQQSVSKFEC